MARKPARHLSETGFRLIIPAASYSPTQLPAQYHRLQEAGTSVFGMGTGVGLSTNNQKRSAEARFLTKDQFNPSLTLVSTRECQGS